jgi:flagellar basal-body rod modification protein FlgD
MPAAPGDYALVVRAVDKNDQALTADSLIKGRVEAVDMTAGGSQLETSAGTFALDKVERVGAAL